MKENDNAKRERNASRKDNLALRKKRTSYKDNLALHIMALPGVINILVFSYWPLYGLLIAFKNYKARYGILGSEWVGLNNFKFLFASSDTWLMVRNTIGYNVVFIVLNLVLAVTLAILLNELYSKRFAKVVQTIYIMPYFLSITAVAIIVYSFLAPTSGVLTAFCEKMGWGKINFYNEPKYWPFFFVIINAWKGVGYSAIVYLASITGISKEYYEAAMLDGASKMQQIRYITLPQLRTIICVLMIMNMGGIFSGDFGLFYSVPFSETNKMVYASGVSKIIDTYIYNAFKVVGDTGLSVASGFFQSIVGFITIGLANTIVSKIEPDNALF